MTAADLLTGIQIGIAVVVLIILYHVLFIVVDVRKSVSRVEKASKGIEQTVMEPIKAVQKGFAMMQSFSEKKTKSKSKK